MVVLVNFSLQKVQEFIKNQKTVPLNVLICNFRARFASFDFTQSLTAREIMKYQHHDALATLIVCLLYSPIEE